MPDERRTVFALFSILIVWNMQCVACEGAMENTVSSQQQLRNTIEIVC